MTFATHDSVFFAYLILKINLIFFSLIYCISDFVVQVIRKIIYFVGYQTGFNLYYRRRQRSDLLLTKTLFNMQSIHSSAGDHVIVVVIQCTSPIDLNPSLPNNVREGVFRSKMPA